ncbi:MAG: hypothetical protein PHH37_06915 [Paludibacter sp.]|nr:hypothetical protein [Paludibacter sp.]
MKKNYFLSTLCFALLMIFNVQAANVVPEQGKYYNIVQSPSGMVIGVTNSTQPVVQSKSSSLAQAFEFVPVEGLTDTYFIRNVSGMYLSKIASSDWSTVYLSEPNAESSEWVIADVDTSAVVFRLELVFNTKYLATDAVDENSYMYCDKTVDNVMGVFKLEDATVPSELINAYNSLSLGDDLSAVTENLTLPTSDGNVQIAWASSNSALISTEGVVTQPEKYDATATLTATLSMTYNDETFSLTKEFVVTVKSQNEAPLILAQWDFSSAAISLVDGQWKVKDESESGFDGTVMNDASIKTIGTPDNGTYNVLYTGNGSGYFDMGTDLGEAIYSLKDYSMSCYFRVDSSYSTLTDNGNFLWTFSNSNDISNDPSGYIINILGKQRVAITKSNWGAEQAVSVAAAPTLGTWHHFAYIQDGTTGTIYIDGVQMAQNTGMTSLPSTVLPIEGRTGTLYNWLGRSCYTSDSYLKKTMLYDFRVLGVPLTEDDLVNGYEGFDPVSETLDALNAAYAEDSDYVVSELPAERDNLTLSNLDAVTSNLTLPTQGELDPTISIIWKSSNDSLITSAGVVTRPKYFSYPVTLTATLMKNGQSVSKSFDATVIVADGTEFTGDLWVKYDFSNVSDSVVTDVAEKHFQGVLKNEATIRSIGTTETGIYQVLDLGDSIGYFDMGNEVGKVMYNLKDFTIGAYYRIDEDYSDDDLSSDGNFLWTFSNSKDINNDPTGYFVGILKKQVAVVSPTNWNSEQTVGPNTVALKGGWHYLGYTQKDTIGTLYIDGAGLESGTVTQLLANSLPKSGKLGTIYNWIGRSCYTGDVYLRKTLVYDLRIYNKALEDIDFLGGEMSVADTIDQLNAAYTASPSGIYLISDSYYKIITDGNLIKITGLKGTENVSLFDITGRKLSTSKSQNEFNVNTGIYLVKVDNTVTKVIVK